MNGVGVGIKSQVIPSSVYKWFEMYDFPIIKTYRGTFTNSPTTHLV